jgi:hypothetical protein
MWAAGAGGPDFGALSIGVPVCGYTVQIVTEDGKGFPWARSGSW